MKENNMKEIKERENNLGLNEGTEGEVLNTENGKEASSKKGIIIGIVVSLIVVVLVIIGIIVFSKKDNSQEQTNPIDTEVKVEERVEVSEPTVEETEKVEESEKEEFSTEETEEEDSTANLSNEEWVEYLNIQRPTFLIFNEITGERKALEDGEEYTLVEGDELALRTPNRWLWQGDNVELYTSTEIKYDCLVYNLNYDLISEKTEFTVKYNNRDGEPFSTTVYLSK